MITLLGNPSNTILEYTVDFFVLTANMFPPKPFDYSGGLMLKVAGFRLFLTAILLHNNNILPACGHEGSSHLSRFSSALVFFLFFFFFHLTYSRWTSSLPSCLWSQRIFPSLPRSRLTIFYRDASSALLLQLVNQWLNFTYSRSHASRYERKNLKFLTW